MLARRARGPRSRSCRGSCGPPARPGRRGGSDQRAPETQPDASGLTACSPCLEANCRQGHVARAAPHAESDRGGRSPVEVLSAPMATGHRWRCAHHPSTLGRRGCYGPWRAACQQQTGSTLGCGGAPAGSDLSTAFRGQSGGLRRRATVRGSLRVRRGAPAAARGARPRPAAAARGARPWRLARRSGGRGGLQRWAAGSTVRQRFSVVPPVGTACLSSVRMVLPTVFRRRAPQRTAETLPGARGARRATDGWPGAGKVQARGLLADAQTP